MMPTTPLNTRNRQYRQESMNREENATATAVNQKNWLWATRHAHNTLRATQCVSNSCVSPKNTPCNGSSQKKILRSRDLID